MQLIIETNEASPRELLAAADMLRALAGVTDKPLDWDVGGAKTPYRGPSYAEFVAAAQPHPVEDVPQAAQMYTVPVIAEGVFAGEAEAVFTQGAMLPDAAAATAPDMTPSESNSSAPTSQGSAAAVELDRDGLPWDARIHSSARSKIAAGTWKMKRGIPDDVVARVTAELRAVMAAPAFPLPPAAAPVNAHPVAAVAPTPTNEALAMPSPPPAAMTFADLMQIVTRAQTSGHLSPAGILDAVRSVGLNALPDLLHRPDLVPAVGAAIAAAAGQ